MMYPRIEYEMSEKDLEKILEVCKPTPCISFNGMTTLGGTPQENANRAWGILGKKMGFDSDTVKPISGRGSRFFTAVPSETEEQKKERVEKERKDKVSDEINALNKEIEQNKKRLGELEKTV